jgi:xyloglucan fucosyltransferase
MPLLNFRNSNKHFVVGFFHIPTLRPLLELMFPEHNVLHLLAQNLLSPSEMVWNKVKDFYETYLLQATSECSCKNPKVWVPWWSGPLFVKSKSQQCPIEMEEELERELTSRSLNPLNASTNTSQFMSPLLWVATTSVWGKAWANWRHTGAIPGKNQSFTSWFSRAVKWIEFWQICKYSH